MKTSSHFITKSTYTCPVIRNYRTYATRKVSLNTPKMFNVLKYSSLKYSVWYTAVTGNMGFFWKRSYHFNGKVLSRLMKKVKSQSFRSTAKAVSLAP
jgi:hypothetical protein